VCSLRISRSSLTTSERPPPRATANPPTPTSPCSLWSRANSLFFYGLTALFIAAAASNATTLWFTPRPLIHALALNKLKSLKPMRDPSLPSRNLVTDRAVFTFDMDADLRGVFNWNVKQLFLYITVDYASPVNVRAEEGGRAGEGGRGG